jgi:FkbM family methyltransferase
MDVPRLGRLARHWLVRAETPRLFPDGVRSRIAGIELFIPAGMLHHYRYGFESQTFELFRSLLRPACVVVDVGANAGLFTLAASESAFEVHAVEPSPPNLRILRRNISHLPNVIVHPVAASDTTGIVSFGLALESGSDSIGVDTPGASLLERVEVPAEQLDTRISAPVDLVKMDVQGAEVLALRGMRRLLAGSPNVKLLVEWSPSCLEAVGFTAEDLITELRACGLHDIRGVVDGRIVSLEEARRHNAGSDLGYCDLLAARAAVGAG